jgi:hypothetical protein
VSQSNPIAALAYSGYDQVGGVIRPYLDNKDDVVRLDLLSEKFPAVLNGPLFESFLDPFLPLADKVAPAFACCERHSIDNLV